VANVLIPVELQEGKAILPSLFLSRVGFENLDRGSYVDHMIGVAGKSFKVDGSKLLDVLEQVKTSNNTIVEDVDLAVIKMASENSSTLPYNVLYAKMDEATPDVQLPKVESTEESKFAEKLGKPDGIARFIHGDRVVEAGRLMLARKMAEMGYSVQVKVGEVEKDKIFY
jgi:hypothetical protein